MYKIRFIQCVTYIYKKQRSLSSFLLGRKDFAQLSLSQSFTPKYLILRFESGCKKAGRPKINMHSQKYKLSDKNSLQQLLQLHIYLFNLTIKRIVISQMSKVLQSIKPQITKARNLALFGKYSESVADFTEIINKITTQLTNINDKTLVEQWNKLLESVKYEKEMANNMNEILFGNLPSKEAKNQRPRTKVQHSESSTRFTKGNNSEEFQNQGRQSFQGNMKRQRTNHEDDQLYNKKEKELKEKERLNRIQAERQRQQRQKQFEEREKQIWPTKTNTKTNGVKTPNQKQPNNGSGVATGNGKPRNPKTKTSSKQQKKQQKKSYLKFCYPDGNGPDSNLIEMLEKQVVSFNLDITFDDIAELEKAKDVLEEAVLLPLVMPQLFKGIRRAWKGVLLFGPPGTGKTLLAKAIASGGKTTFFNVTASSLASKWKGDSQKLVRILFDMAKFYAPTTIFIDEIDSLASKRGEKEDQSSRKVKTQLMTRIDGVSSGEQGKSIVVIGATNRPWDLDEAIRRRLQKRIYIPLPTQIGRRQMLRINLKDVQLQETVELQEVVNKTDGYSGADIALLCRQAAYMPMRRKLKREGGLGKKLGNIQWMKAFQKDVTVPLAMQDFNEALKNVKPSVGKNDLTDYQKWMGEFGQQGTN